MGGTAWETPLGEKYFLVIQAFRQSGAVFHYKHYCHISLKIEGNDLI